MNWHKLFWIALAIAFVLLQFALIGAKLAGHIHASWWWIMLPLWSPLVCIMAAAVIAIALLGNASANGGNPFQ